MEKITSKTGGVLDFCKTSARVLLSFMLILVAMVTGASSGVMMAEASNLPDAGVTAAGADGTGGTSGIATETQGREDGDPEFYSKRLISVSSRFARCQPRLTR